MKRSGSELGNLSSRLMAHAQMKKKDSVRTGEIASIPGITDSQERDLLRRLSASGWIVRLKRGVYLVPSRLPAGGKFSPGSGLILKKLMEEELGTYQVCGPNAFNLYGFDGQLPNVTYVYNDRIAGNRSIGSRGLKPEDFGKKSVLRNPNSANLLQRIGYIEKMGTGISKMRGLMDEGGLDPIEFGNFFTATFRRPKAGEVPVSTEIFTEDFGRNFGTKFGVKGKRLGRLLAIVQLLYEGRPVDPAQLTGEFKVTTRTIENDIQFLRQNDLVEFTGPKKSGVYLLTEKARDMIRETRR